MRLDTVQEIERAIDALTPQQLEECACGLTGSIRSLSTPNLRPTLQPGASTTVSIAPWPTTEPETHSLSSGLPVSTRD